MTAAKSGDEARTTTAAKSGDEEGDRNQRATGVETEVTLTYPCESAGMIRLPRFIGDLVYDSGGNVSDSS